jgi:signal transduction histidine kinase/CheY-like chemotaxis protein
MIKFLRPPVYEDDTKTYQALLLYLASMLLSVGAVFMIIYTFLYPATFPVFIYLSVFLLAWQALLLYLNYNNSTRLGAWIYLTVGWLVLSFIVYKDGGISSPNYAFYFSYIIIAGILIDWRAGIILGIFSLLTGVFFLLAKSHNLLPEPFMNADQNSMLFTYSLIIIIIVSLQSIASYTVFKSLNNARNENEQRKKTEYLLKIQNEEFLTLNKELSESYEQLRNFNSELAKAKAQAEAADHLKSAFLANMSHEIRTPMNAIVGFSQLLDSDEITEEKKKQYLSIIHKKSNDLLTIINDIFDISKLETNQIEIFNEAGNSNALLNEVYHEFEITDELIDQTEVTLRVGNLPNDDESWIVADFKRLKQILVNLIGNAIKFTEHGYIEIGCKIINNSLIEFYVEDSGIGILKDKHDLIFDRFRQVEEKQPSKSHGGTGLGLSISKGLVELMHGKIQVESEINKGSRFSFSLPYIQSERNTVQENKKSGNVYYWKGRKILIVEDDKFNMEYFKKALSHTMADLYMAKTGEEARILFKKEVINLVLMDIRLPDTSGYILTREFLSSRPELKIIAQTAYAGPDDRQKAIEAGCSDVITKPIQLDKLMQLIDNLIL